ncbi:MAG: phosphoribosylformylglycinamidine synthase subunit PurQ, partial [Lachnospiraceae bacterium]|nr:phosphoribosylformylglycinamidine synthase subunit PurQ [Lachnospiraceae bacterium]
IGGKDSMSGSFNEIHVPPTLVSFAVDVAKTDDIITPELKEKGNKLAVIRIPADINDLPDHAGIMKVYGSLITLMRQGVIRSAYALDAAGAAPALSVMAFGNGLGVKITDGILSDDLFTATPGDILVEIRPEDVEKLNIFENVLDIGEVTESGDFELPASLGGGTVSGRDALEAWMGKLESVFRTKTGASEEAVDIEPFHADSVYICKHKVAKPTVFIPVFPGTNCEYDSARAFERAGAEVNTLVFRNRNAADILESVEAAGKAISQAQIVMFPGGFSAGDEPDGSAKFFATAFRNEKIKEAMQKLLGERDGLVLGICNGFQAVIKLGLVPYGEIKSEQTADSPTLTRNTIGRHISRMAYLKVMTDRSPWLSLADNGGVYVVPASHGEGRFVAPDAEVKRLIAAGQVGTVYCDPDGNVTMNDEWNINGSMSAIEGITSPDGRCYGKMCHVERIGDGVAKNIYGDQDMHIFEAGVRYFR